jgi:hypothetical protein
LLSQIAGVVGLEHWVAPGMHEPVQVPAPAQRYGHVWLVCQAPVASQDWEALPEHRVLAGTQTPVHAPAPEQTYGQVLVVAHWPIAVHVRTSLPEHCT